MAPSFGWSLPLIRLFGTLGASAFLSTLGFGLVGFVASCSLGHPCPLLVSDVRGHSVPASAVNTLDPPVRPGEYVIFFPSENCLHFSQVSGSGYYITISSLGHSCGLHGIAFSFVSGASSPKDFPVLPCFSVPGTSGSSEPFGRISEWDDLGGRIAVAGRRGARKVWTGLLFELEEVPPRWLGLRR